MHPIENIMKTTMEEIGNMIDVNTIVGDPVTAPNGAVIIPVSKVSFGFISGGGEYEFNNKKTAMKELSRDPREQQHDASSKNTPFAGAASAGISLNPIAFLVVSDKNIRMLPVNSDSTIDKLIDLAPQMVDEVRTLIENNKAQKQQQIQ